MSTPRALPASDACERAVVGAMFVWPAEVLGLCAERGLAEDWFHSTALRTTYAVGLALHDAHKKVDARSVMQALADRRQLEEVGGAAALVELSTYPTAANVGHDIDTLREKWQLREVIRVGSEAVRMAYEEQERATEVLEQFEQDALSIRAKTDTRELLTPRESVMRALNSIQELYERRGQITGLSTGLQTLDDMTDGLQPTNLYVIAARPSMGKTALAMNMAEHIGLEGNPVAVFSLEMSSDQLWRRMLLSRAKVNGERVRKGFLIEGDFPKLTSSASKFADSGIWVDDTSGISIQALRGKARRMKQKHGIKAIFVDYLQLCTSHTKRGKDNRQQEVAEISSGLKSLAKELQLPVVVLAQLNRNPEARGGAKVAVKGKPKLGDLRESGAIEQDADFVGLLYREEYYAEDDEEKERLSGQATLSVAKQRNGPVGDIALTFLKEFTRFEVRAGDGF